MSAGLWRLTPGMTGEQVYQFVQTYVLPGDCVQFTDGTTWLFKGGYDWKLLNIPMPMTVPVPGEIVQKIRCSF